MAPITRLERRVRKLAIWCTLFTLAVGVGMTIGYFRLQNLAAENRRLALEGKQAHDVACAQKKALVRQVIRSEAFLRDNPGPFPIANIPRKTIRDGITEQRDLYKGYKLIDCLNEIPLPPEPANP